MSVDEAELIVFLLDGSGSMKSENTPDGKQKIEHLNLIVKSVLQRLQNSSKVNSFKIALVYFSTNVTVESNGGRDYFSVSEALGFYKNPLDVVGGEKTAIADALKETSNLLDKFNEDEGIPSIKHATVLLFTDGNEVIKTSNDVINEAQNLISHIISPSIATISFGSDADEHLLESIATQPNERQIQHLRNANVYHHLKNRQKLFLVGHESGKISEEKVIAIRNFIETLSKTASAKKG